MPPLGLILGNVNFTELFIALDGGTYASLATAQEAGAPTLNYGVFLNTIIDFLIVAFVIFLVIRQVNRLQAEEEEAPAEPTAKECPYCKSEIAIAATRCPQCTSQLQATEVS
jgi:large conductance mechanosensitive channel